MSIQNLSNTYRSQLLFWAVVLVLQSHAIQADGQLQQFKELQHSGLLVTTDSGDTLFSSRATEAFVPASTMKLITTWLALQHWGEQHRFSTTFTYDYKRKTLWIKAGGDPFLISEELELIAQKIGASGVRQIDTIALDVSMFEADLKAPGASSSNNPYDAIQTALAANFNTLYVQRIGADILSAEPQTPLTPVAKSMASTLDDEKLRINTGQSSSQSERYFAELMAEFLRLQGVRTGNSIEWGRAPNLPVLLEHHNSRTLGEVLQLMLKYSNNFIANQILLTLVSEFYDQPADFDSVRQYSEQTLQKRFDWSDFSIFDGAGLSRQNRLSSRHLIDVLHELKPWRHLLPEVESGVLAKTGTLDGVSTLAGFLKHDVAPSTSEPRLFALLINQPVDSGFTRKLALELRDLNTQ